MPMWNATIDIAGLYAMDNTIFDNMVFPTSTVVDKEGVSHSLSLSDEVKTNIIDMILFKSEGRCVRYEDPDTFKNRLAILSNHMSRDKWERIMYYNFFTRTFDPTENVFEITHEETKRQNGRTLTYTYSNYKETSAQTADGKNNTSFSNYLETDEQVVDGKNNTSFNNYLETDEQVVDGKNNTTYSNYKETNAQTADGKNNESYVNYKETDSQTTSGTKENHGAKVHGVGSMDSSASVSISQGQSDGYGTVSGSLPIENSDTYNDKTTENMGVIEHSKSGAINVATSEGTKELSKEGAINIAVGSGKVEHAKEGSINIAVGSGKVEHSKEGAVNVALSQGTVEKSISGSKAEAETFAANPDLFERNRHGNIGVTMSGEIIKNTFETEEGLDIESTIIDDVIDNLALAVF